MHLTIVLIVVSIGIGHDLFLISQILIPVVEPRLATATATTGFVLALLLSDHLIRQVLLLFLPACPLLGG